ncbi:tetratricopeptide repeat protein [Streptomyces sp. NPDC088253]|uniref:tetratricopeptide repeat protein n=1 Tax=Streptomyces sp. NPDC088253 TaxID=3365846 RepID=UPI003801F7DD
MFASELSALKKLAGDPLLTEIVRQGKKQIPAVTLTTSTLSGWFRGRSAPEPEPPIAFLLQFLHGRAKARGKTDLYGVDWYEDLRVRAWNQKTAARGGRPGKPRSRPPSSMMQELPTVLEVDPLLMGVHRPIRVPGHDDSTLPPYVRRDVDHGADGLRARMRTASRKGGFFVLVGGSSVGKSRTLYEALLDTVPNWHLFHPSSAADLTTAVESAPHRLAIWLDDLRPYVEGPSGIGAPEVRALLRSGALIVATMGPRHYADFTAQPEADDAEDRYQGKRELLKVAHVCHLSSDFSVREWGRADTTARKSAAAGDRRLQVALMNARSALADTKDTVNTTGRSSMTSGPPKKDAFSLRLSLDPEGGLSAVQSRAILWFKERLDAARPPMPSEGSRFGLTQTMAAAPQLVERWRNADSQDMPYARSVLAAGVDLARLGVNSPLTPELLKAAAWGYCTSEQRARATVNWFDEALAYARRRLLGATSALVPVMAGAGEAEAICYRPADYLLERVSEERRDVVPPSGFWDACLKHVTDRRDLLEVGRSAADRLRYIYAAPLLTRSFTEGDSEAYTLLSGILFGQQRVGEIVQLTLDHEDRHGRLSAFAVTNAARQMAESGYVEEALRHLEPHGNDFMTSFLRAKICNDAALLPQLAGLSAKGNTYASGMLALRFSEAGSVLFSFAGQIMEILKSLDGADAEELPLPQLTHDQMVQVGDLLEILFEDRPGPSSGLFSIGAGTDITFMIGQLLEASKALMEEARRLFDLAEVDEPRQAASGDDRPEPSDLARKLEKAGDLDGALNALEPVRGDQDAEWTRSSLLRKHGRDDAAFEGLRSLAESGDFNSAIHLSEMLADSGRAEDALTLLRDRERAGDPFVSVWLNYLLAEQGNAHELADRAMRGDDIARERLVHVAADALVGQGRQGEAFHLLRQQVDTGRKLAATDLIQWLERHGLAEDAARLEQWGLDADGDIAVPPVSFG